MCAKITFESQVYQTMREKKAKKLLQEVQKTYNAIAEEFSKTRQFIGKEFEFFKPLLRENQSIVDLGCGNGRLLIFLKKNLKTFHYTGVDNSENLLTEAKKLYPETSDIQFIESDMLTIPLSDLETDLIFSLRAFHHLPTEKLQLQALHEMKRILKKNGLLILTVWNLWQKDYAQELGKAFIHTIMTFGRSSFRDIYIGWNTKHKRYYHAFTEGKLKKLVHKAGFELLTSVSRKEQQKIGIHDYIIIARKK